MFSSFQHTHHIYMYIIFMPKYFIPLEQYLLFHFPLRHCQHTEKQWTVCVLILYSVTLLKSHILGLRRFLWNFLHRWSCCLGIETVLFVPFQLVRLLFPFVAIQRMTWTFIKILIGEIKSIHPYLVLIHEKSIQLLIIKHDVSCRAFVRFFTMIHHCFHE